MRVTESPSRRERVDILIKQLDATVGPALVPLTRSLAARAYWAAQTPIAAATLLRLAADDSNAIRTASLQTLEQVVAIEHAADPGLTDAAMQAISAIREPRTTAELWNILNTSLDRAWNAAALAGLVALRDPQVKERLFEPLKNPHDPLLASAVSAAGELGDPDCLPLVAALIGSRNDQVVLAALSTIAKLAAPDNVGDDAEDRKSFETVFSSVLALLADPDANQQLRIAAFDAAKTLAHPRVREVFTKLADTSALEDTPLLPRLERQLRRTTEHAAQPKPGANTTGKTLECRKPTVAESQESAVLPFLFRGDHGAKRVLVSNADAARVVCSVTTR